MPLPIAAIVGRPNVGKSSLFNRLIKKRLAVVDATSGVTRDRNFSTCEWNDREFYLVDTGGMVPGSRDLMERLIMEQAGHAVVEADLILFVVDCQTGITDLDQEIARLMRRTEKPVLLLANKADNETLALEGELFIRLGIGELFPVSAANGFGTGDMLDRLAELLPGREEEPEEEGIRVAVVGRPNVGKSSFVNSLLGEDRLIVSEIPGTTRDAVDTGVEFEGQKYVLVDTAGLRKRSKVKESIEYYTTLRTLRAIQRCEVALVLLDANEGLNFQTLKIIEEVGECRRGMALVVNKWDIFEKDENTAAVYERQLHEAMPTYDYLPVMFVSALTGKRVAKTLETVNGVYTNFARHVPTPELNAFIEEAAARQHPAAVRGKWIKFYYMTQAETAPPVFVLFCNFPNLIQESYRRYLLNQLRERFDFTGVPLTLKLRSREKKKASRRT